MSCLIPLNPTAFCWHRKKVNNKPIGIFDSGMGGLSVASCIIKALPNESIAYFADFLHVPYGEKPYEQIKAYAATISKYLVSKNVKIIVTACNLSSAVAIDDIKSLFPTIPIIGMIKPGAKAACDAASDKPIGILATTGTIKSNAYEDAIKQINKNIKVFGVACPEFVPLVEKGMTHTTEAYKAAEKYVRPLLEKDCKTIVLGCTHYPFLIDAIKEVTADATIIDPAHEVTKTVMDTLSKTDALANTKNALHSFYASAKNDNFQACGSSFLGETIESVELVSMNKTPN